MTEPELAEPLTGNWLLLRAGTGRAPYPKWASFEGFLVGASLGVLRMFYPRITLNIIIFSCSHCEINRTP
jgi:hypothetical protein